ncbi:hypothetical protein M409DRAFT_27579 [Zasmidium cellare ATCC 36951]|uniref:SET domain-containing protein n=1 Tax=Zasmidium cellare ATCC 36951 TaxID=1080233 RepID=A0A6A6C587_ZASCE|nr:uncharacterized protein M409DRAFT_27579 [Zasmidium cellare ATCC 36951]KAF2162201.1 hypothetical protein M409DRAFT_27579 [Zasmidium cellare ATCC 36951]
MNAHPPSYIILNGPDGLPRLLASTNILKGQPIMSYSAHLCVLNANADIARVSHSCIPNAFQHWDPDSHEMILRALQHIAERQEITISYEQDVDTFLMPKAERMQHLRQLLGLQITCTCSACGPSDAQHGTDDSLRVETAELLEMIKPLPLLDDDFELSIHTTHINLRQLQKLHEQYIKNLVQLAAKDHKLCHAYWLLYQFHAYIADHADDRETRKIAVAALQLAIAVCVTCYGNQHHKVQELDAEMSELKHKVVEVLSKHFHRNRSVSEYPTE